MTASTAEHELIELLNRQVKLDAISALIDSIRPPTSEIDLKDTAIGLDANAFLRINNNKKSEDIVDYLGTAHSAPLILPGQTIQEFWNNQLVVVDTIASALRGKIDALKAEITKLQDDFGDYAIRIEALIDEFNAQHGHVYDEATVRKTLALLEILQAKAKVPYAPRLALQEIALHRKRTKTPPGFKDGLDGDFFVWADFLTGLQQCRAEGAKFSRAVLVTLDKKPDWSRSGKAHPILVAEVRALLNIPFEIWTIDKLAEEVANAT